MEIQVKHSVLKKNGDKVRFRKFQKNGYDHYMIKLYLSGKNLSEIVNVEYELHPSFYKPLRSSSSYKDQFSISFWTWGEFDISVTVYFKNGKRNSFIYSLQYSKSLPTYDNEYIDESPQEYRTG